MSAIWHMSASGWVNRICLQQLGCTNLLSIADEALSHVIATPPHDASKKLDTKDTEDEENE